MRPLVDAPQMKKLPPRSQKSRDLTPMRRPRNALAIGLPVLVGTVSASVAPKARRPRSDGRLRRKRATTGTTARAATATAIAASRQPALCASHPSPGKKMSCPVAPAAVSAPSTSPRRCTNQRFATVAASTEAMHPVPSPTTTPHSRYSCHGAFITVVRRAPVATVIRAPTVTTRSPKRSIRAAANGPVSPNKMRLIETAMEMMARFQPNSSCSGTISTLGVARNPAAPISATNVTAATTHA